ncbi:MAG: MFS transporter, partial [Planctomycetota bacterium]
MPAPPTADLRANDVSPDHPRLDRGENHQANAAIVDAQNKNTESATSPDVASGALGPFLLPLYRVFWGASLFSNLGTWVHEIGAGWLMTELNGNPQVVASVRTAMALPIMFLAIPAGVIADRFDRRWLLLGTQIMLLGVALTLALCTYYQMVSVWGLLIATAAMGIGMTLHVPTWQATIPQLVSRPMLPQAVALGSLSFNLARCVGPAVGGFCIWLVGIWSAFALNSISFTGVILAVLWWNYREPRATDVQTRSRHSSRDAASFWDDMIQGVRFALTDTIMRRTLCRLMMFIFPAAGFWALAPWIARYHLNWSAEGYGMLIGTLGGGAVAMAFFLPTLRRILGVNQMLLLLGWLFAGAFVVIGFVDSGVG